MRRAWRRALSARSSGGALHEPEAPPPPRLYTSEALAAARELPMPGGLRVRVELAARDALPQRLPLLALALPKTRLQTRASDARVLGAELPQSAAADADFEAAREDQLLYAPATAPESAPARVMFARVAGDGEPGEDVSSALADTVARVAAAAQKRRLDTVAIALPAGLSRASASVAAATRAWVAANTPFDKYLGAKRRARPVAELLLLAPRDADEGVGALQEAARRAQIGAECALLAGEIKNERADAATPAHIHAVAEAVAAAHGLQMQVVAGARDLEAAGLSMMAAVGQGARHEPRLVALAHRGAPASNEWTAIVGKGVTFDTGGLNLKATGRIETMHLDKTGAAAALGVAKGAAALRLPLNLVCVLALAENAIGPAAYKPLAVLHSARGSVEVSNTDAEGRLLLADALTWTQRCFRPATVIDIATLTGAAAAAVGKLGALFARDDALAAALLAAAREAGEGLWRLPLDASHVKQLEGRQSDWRSTSGAPGASVGAAFVGLFVERGVAWAHLDVAGAMGDAASGANTAFGVHTLLEWLARRAA